MTQRLSTSLLLSLLAVSGVGLAGGAKEPGKAQLPGLRLDLKAKTIEIDGSFCIGDYPLELLVCKGTLRDYESMITTACKPSHLHAALLALGLKPRVRDQKDPGKILREGDPIDVLVRYRKDGKEVTIEPRALIDEIAIDPDTNKQLRRHIGATPFVFYGSFLFPDHRDKSRMIYLADAEDWLIGLLGDTASVIDLAQGQTGKYGNLEIDAKLVPPKGTKATVIIRPAAKRKPAGGKKAPVPARSK